MEPTLCDLYVIFIIFFGIVMRVLNFRTFSPRYAVDPDTGGPFAARRLGLEAVETSQQVAPGVCITNALRGHASPVRGLEIPSVLGGPGARLLPMIGPLVMRQSEQRLPSRAIAKSSLRNPGDDDDHRK